MDNNQAEGELGLQIQSFNTMLIQSQQTIMKIEQIFSEIAEGLLENGGGLTINLKTRNRANGQFYDPGSGTIMQNADTAKVSLCYPGKSSQESWRFTVVHRILELIHKALSDRETVTKRSRDLTSELFKRQSVVDKYIDDIACTFQSNRESLNVIATAKGLLAGPIKVIKEDGTVVEFAGSNQAKGYPDIVTRAFLHRLSKISTIPIYGLADFDPHGIGIISTYKHGSIAMAHQNETLAASETHWLGLHSADLAEPSLSRPVTMSLTAGDRTKALSLLSKEYMGEHGKEKGWRLEVQRMLMLNRKAEIQMMNESDSSIFCEWIESKMEIAQAQNST
ncbi:MAG: hypothetical protein M1814_001424 [Vezdaea aestivalis]|nr:MAG: hypothetical protein M1814_001424 [Vezdaea aestivalis]